MGEKRFPVEGKQCFCTTPLDDCVVTRRCFMTGEYCSQQYNIQKARNALHHNNEISAFVVMGFSDMSDVVYKWRIKPFIESLTKYFWINQSSSKLYCSACKPTCEYDENCDWKEINKINVIRSDSDPASNYVICNRICQQLQIADLVIVDFSTQNPNVMYEFGMAVALHKLILPICFSESFYHRVLPEGKMLSANARTHIGLYPWRKMLFEHYGILFSQKTKTTKYAEYDIATNDENGFDDVKYARFPYAECIRDNAKTIGETIYDLLKRTYNNSTPDDNTLIVYTMEGFLNEREAASCICTFYWRITSQMTARNVFCGDRVGVLVQNQAVFEKDKDAAKRAIPYNIGEIIRIGINQATFLCESKKVYPDDMYTIDQESIVNCEQKKEIMRFIKDHIRNRGMIIYPNNPVYVERIKKDLNTKYLFQDSSQENIRFYLFYIMIMNLRYVNEVVVDISDNALLGLFWLGAAHGSDINAITVRHDPNPLDTKHQQVPRNVFDVSGLWTAIYHSHDTDGFYHQLALVQTGIERHSKLMLSNIESIEEEIKEDFYHDESFPRKLSKLHEQYIQQTHDTLESYYRSTFWKPILSYNKLRIYVGQVEEKAAQDNETHRRVAQWDFDAISTLTHYLSKHTPIGEYVVIASAKGDTAVTESRVNSLFIGNANQFASEAFLKPLDTTISQWCHIPCLDVIPYLNNLHFFNSNKEPCILNKSNVNRGFYSARSEKESYFTQHTDTTCLSCDKQQDCFKTPNKFSAQHDQLAQLVLWREEQQERHKDDNTNDETNIPIQSTHFKVAIIGSSGPSTFGLSALFVDRKHKLYRHSEPRNDRLDDQYNNINHLHELQRIVRDKFMNVFSCLLKNQYEHLISENEGTLDKNHISEICEAIGTCTMTYLSTILFKFFLPFYTMQEQEQICNSVRTFLNSMRTASIFPFDNVEEMHKKLYQGIEKTTVDTLEITMSAFKGMEVFYRVTVNHKYPANDTPGASDTSQGNVHDTRYAEAVTLARSKDPDPKHSGDHAQKNNSAENTIPLIYYFFDTDLLNQKMTYSSTELS